MAAPVAVERWLTTRFGYEPRDPRLFAMAMTHRSASSHNNERLEFLGDAVLNLLVAEHLFADFPDADEGDLSRLRARVVSAEPLASLAASLALGDVIQLGGGELKTGGFRRQSILADAFEALVGAVFLDRGFDAVRERILPLVKPLIDKLPEPAALKDPKTRLQEWLQARGENLPEYRVLSVGGEAHEQSFVVECELQARGLNARGEGSSRRRAEQAAATSVLRLLDPAATP